jgi:hypothetical protein
VIAICQAKYAQSPCKKTQRTALLFQFCVIFCLHNYAIPRIFMLQDGIAVPSMNGIKAIKE